MHAMRALPGAQLSLLLRLCMRRGPWFPLRDVDYPEVSAHIACCSTCPLPLEWAAPSPTTPGASSIARPLRTKQLSNGAECGTFRHHLRCTERRW